MPLVYSMILFKWSILFKSYFIFLHLFVIIIINILHIKNLQLDVKLFNSITFIILKYLLIILKNVFHLIQNYLTYIFFATRNKILFTSKFSYFQLYKTHFYSTRLNLILHNSSGIIPNECATIQKLIFDLEKKRRDFRREMPLLWMRFTLVDRRSNISVGKPIYIPLCVARESRRMQITEIGQYVANICFDFSSGTYRLTRRLLKDPLLKDIRDPFPWEFAPVLISSCIYTTLLAIYAPRGMRPRAFRNMDAHFTIVPILRPPSR